jgi:hypothetical protein
MQIFDLNNRMQVEASMCYLRGILMLKLNRSTSAKESFMEALALDVKCYDAFEMLVGGEMMTIDEGESICFELLLNLTQSFRVGVHSNIILQITRIRGGGIRASHVYNSFEEGNGASGRDEATTNASLV